jgi:hypothetical protein
LPGYQLAGHSDESACKYHPLKNKIPCFLWGHINKNTLTPKISGLCWWILDLKYVFIDMYDKDQNELNFFSTFNCKILYLAILIVCWKNHSQRDHTNYKIITIGGEEQFFWIGCLDYCQCFENQ